MNKCEMTNCKNKVFATAFPDKNPVRLCKEHFQSEMGHLAADAPIVDMTEETPFGIKAGDPLDPEWVVDRLLDIAEEINKLKESIK